MKKLSEKVALVAELCIAAVFIITTILYMTNAIPQAENWQENGVMSVLMIVLGAIFLGLAVYLIYMSFSDKQNLKKILLFCDNGSTTHTNVKVIEGIVANCAKLVDGVVVKKIRINSDDKGGYTARINVKVSVENVAESINKLRLLLVDSFKNTLGLTFNSIDFQIEKISGKYTPNVAAAEEAAEKLSESTKPAESTATEETTPAEESTTEEPVTEEKETEDA